MYLKGKKSFKEYKIKNQGKIQIGGLELKKH